jgi:hypothetical protein
MKGNFHVQFGIGGGEGDLIAAHTKSGTRAPLITVSLEELVPQDHFYRHLERTLDLSCVREFVQETYAGKAHPEPLERRSTPLSTGTRSTGTSKSGVFVI